MERVGLFLVRLWLAELVGILRIVVTGNCWVDSTSTVGKLLQGEGRWWVEWRWLRRWLVEWRPYRPCANEERRHRTIRFPLTVFPSRWCVCKDTAYFLPAVEIFFPDQYQPPPTSTGTIKENSIVFSCGIDVHLHGGRDAIPYNCQEIYKFSFELCNVVFTWKQEEDGMGERWVGWKSKAVCYGWLFLVFIA